MRFSQLATTFHVVCNRFAKRTILLQSENEWVHRDEEDVAGKVVLSASCKSFNAPSANYFTVDHIKKPPLPELTKRLYDYSLASGMQETDEIVLRILGIWVGSLWQDEGGNLKFFIPNCIHSSRQKNLQYHL